jgi:small subunit ribosomal protein S3
VDYGFAASFTTYGAIGVKVWLYRGLYAEKGEDGSIIETGQPEGAAPAGPAEAAPRGPRGRRPRGERKS